MNVKSGSQLLVIHRIGKPSELSRICCTMPGVRRSLLCFMELLGSKLRLAFTLRGIPTADFGLDPRPRTFPVAHGLNICVQCRF